MATEATSSRAFNRFEHRVCKAAMKMQRQADPAVLRYNDLYYGEEEHSPESLEAAGREVRKAYVIYQRFNRRILKMKAPADQARLWHKYGQQERVVLQLGFKGASALEAADLAEFERIKTRNENWQRKRNTTWSRIGLVC
ncbi:MAG TPA: hypothetical protein VLL27_03490 [Solirubrobacterales bacterium]|nr:hypothetical protein [Solirubrobacterales bacterium]